MPAFLRWRVADVLTFAELDSSSWIVALLRYCINFCEAGRCKIFTAFQAVDAAEKEYSSVRTK